MQDYNDKKNIFGIVLFALSIVMLIYMLINPLNQLVFNVEEYFTLTLINFPIADIISMSGSDVNPPLYYLLLKGVSKISEDFFILKVFSVIPYAVILIVSTVKLRNDYGWFQSGLFAFSIAASGGFFTYFLALRPYSWALMFVLLSFIFIRNLDDKKSWIFFTVFSVLSAYTYYFAGITSVSIYILLLAYILKEKRDYLKNWGISFAAFIICLIGWTIPFISFLMSIHGNFWISSPTAETLIKCLSYFAYSSDLLLSTVMILIAVIISIIYLQRKEEDNFYVFGGILTFILTLILGLVISFAFQPVLLERCMLPAAGLVWLSISIMISRFENRTFILTSALIILVLVSGIGFMISQTDDFYTSAASQKEVLDNITSDDIVVLATPNMIVHFLDYADKWDMYCIKVEYIYGENINRVHEFFDFKDITTDKIRELPSDKNIYLISWGELDTDLDTKTLSSENGVVISKLKIPETEQYY